MYTVYALVDPRDYSIRYIGITDDVYARFAQHIRGDGCNPEKDVWIAELRQENIMLIMKTLEVVETVDRARERETFWIHHHQFLGSPLLNQAIPSIHLPTRAVQKPLFKARLPHTSGGARGNYEQVRTIVLYRHTHGSWPKDVSKDMQRWYERQYFTRPSRKNDGERYEKHAKNYARGRQWIAEYESLKSAPEAS